MKLSCIFLSLLAFMPLSSTPRTFIHPGITYTQADLDRMKAMIDARREPFYSTFQQFAASSFAQSTVTGHTNVTRIPEGQHNNYIGMDGRKAHDNALMWHLTGNTAYADNAVRLLNGYLDCTNSSSRGTAPLDNGKIFMLIEAAELMRGYDGWVDTDQQKFKTMLVHPGYSTIEVPSSHFSLIDSLNNVTFYWNIYNFDRARFGNQGLFAARGMMAMGIFLDNEIMYERALRYLLGLPHRPDDLSYNSGPAETGSVKSETDYMIEYNVSYSTDQQDWGYDELLKYYIYSNGQCQESCRDQAHVLAGIGNYTCIAEMAWNQGDSLYGCLDNRILSGIEFNLRYNLSLDSTQNFPDQPSPWEPAGLSTNEGDCSYANGYFYQAMSRSGRWFAKNISPQQRTADMGPSGWREQALAHYKIRMGIQSQDMKWLQRAHDRLIEDYGYENWGVSGHHYEWLGWGTLTKRRTLWMCGDPGTFINGERVSGIPSVPCTIKVVDYDFFSENGEGRTYHNVGTITNTLYRTDGTVEIANDGSDFFVTDMVAGEWMNYGIIFPQSPNITTADSQYSYNVYVTYRSTGEGAALSAAVDSGTAVQILLPSSTQWQEKLLGSVAAERGAGVLRLSVGGQSNLLELKSIRVTPDSGTVVFPGNTVSTVQAKQPTIYYSPVSGKVVITAEAQQRILVELINSSGRVVISSGCQNGMCAIDVGNIVSGIYFLHVSGTSSLFTKRIIIP